MKTLEVKKLNPEERLLYWIKEREKIRLRKDRNFAWPWTDDEILQTFRFCNVRRMDDKVSRWLMRNWYTKANVALTSLPVILRNIALARFLNKPETLQHLEWPTASMWARTDILVKRLRAYRDAGNTTFSAAYVVRGNDGEDKIDSVVNYYCQPLANVANRLPTKTIAEAHAFLLPCFGFGSFMAGQVLADLRWVKPELGWEDRHSWAAKGPGSERGINRLFCREVTNSISQAEFTKDLDTMISICLKRLPASITDRLEAIDFQNCLCEFDKYERALWGQGKPKQTYKRSK